MDLLLGLVIAITLIVLFFPNATKPRHLRKAYKQAPLAEICWRTNDHQWSEWKERDRLETDIVFANVPRLENLKSYPQKDLRYRYCYYCKDVDYTYWSAEKLQQAKEESES